MCSSCKDANCCWCPSARSQNATDFVAVGALLARQSPVWLEFWLVAELLLEPDDDLWLATCSRRGGGGRAAGGGGRCAHACARASRLQDVITAVRLGKPVAQCGFALQPHAERHLRQRVRLAGIYPPELLQATVQIGAALHLQPRRNQIPIPARGRAPA